MKRSQLALASALGTVLVAALAVALWARFDAPPGATLPASFSGERATRDYDLADFSRVDVRGQWQVALTRGDAWSVEVSYPVELEPYLHVNAAGSELVIALTGQQGRWSDFGGRDELRLTAHVVMPELEKVELAGATKLELSGFDGEELELSAAGAFQIAAVDCRYDELDLQMAGAGSADLSGLTATDARVKLAGAHNATLRMAGGTLSGGVAGVSRLAYYGTVASEDVDIAGVSRVQPLD